ncbi:MAG: cardiolipin synthase [Clostridia bacterium]|nr:cardiolipin synthase [Clostridia bacterium]
MKKKIKIHANGKIVEKEINYIPTRYIIAILITILEVAAIIGTVVVLAIFVPYFYTALMITQVVVVISIVVSNNNPDYKLIWLFVVVMIPLVGLMIYLIFYKRKLPKRVVKKLQKINDSYKYDDNVNFTQLYNQDSLIVTQARSLCAISNTHLYQNSKLQYFCVGEDMYVSMIEALQKAEKFIFLEYFIIEDGVFWNSILDILIKKAKQGVEVKLIYDDVGCMGTLPGNYYKTLTKKYDIQTVLFSKMKGQANGEFNNRSHRKILVIDGKVAFTGGINIADEYINKRKRLGHWKDTGIKIEGEAINEFTKLFLLDFCLNCKKEQNIDFNKYYIAQSVDKCDNYVIPFADAPKPLNNYSVSKTAILNLLNQAKKYVYICTPYLIVDNELMKALENTAIRGVDIRIIIPHIPDKKIVFGMTRSVCGQLIKQGVKVYEYTPGFIHAKSYIADDEYGIIGTMNLDYRSLDHNFENGVWIYNDNVIFDMKKDFIHTMNNSQLILNEKPKHKLIAKLIYVLVKIFSPLL